MSTKAVWLFYMYDILLLDASNNYFEVEEYLVC